MTDPLLEENTDNINKKIDRALKALKREYVFVNRVHISVWKFSLIIGIIIGIASGIIFVANRSGEFEKTVAKGITPPLAVSPITLINKDGVVSNTLDVEYVAPKDGSLKKASVALSNYKFSAAATGPASCSKMPIDTENNSQWYPVISGRYIAYQEVNSFPWDITLYDLVTRRKQRLTDVLKSGSSLNVDISGNRIVYQRFKKNIIDDVYLYDILTNTEKRITNTLESRYPAIDGDKIVWYDRRSGDQGDIYLYDLTTNTEQRITTTPDNEGMPDISGNYIVYEGRRGDNWVVSLYDISTNTEQIITPEGSMPYWPKVSGNWVVYYDKRNTNSPGWYDLYSYNIATRTEQRITQAPTILFDFFLTKGAGISGDIVTWADARNGWDIYAYDLIAKTEFQITNDPAPQWSPSISGRRIVWTDIGIRREGDIYLFNATKPTPDIKANGSDGPIKLSLGEPLSVTISLDPGCPEGKSADWWASAVTPFGTYWATPQGWIRSDKPISGYSGPLGWILPTPILQYRNETTYKNTLIFPLFPVDSTLPTGDYIFSFTVDDSMDGVLNGNMYSDKVLIQLKKQNL